MYLNTVLVCKFSKNKCNMYIFIYVYFIVVKNNMKLTLNKFAYVQYSIVNFMQIIVQQISKTFSSFMTEILYLWTSNFHLLLLRALGNYHSTFLFYECDYFRHLIKVKSCSICLSVIGLFCLTFLQGPFMWQHMSRVPSFLGLNK